MEMKELVSGLLFQCRALAFFTSTSVQPGFNHYLSETGESNSLHSLSTIYCIPPPVFPGGGKDALSAVSIRRRGAVCTCA